MNRGWELKVSLVRAQIKGIDAIRSACSDARIVNADALCRVVPPLDQPELAKQADEFNNIHVFQSWDMLCGRLLPELGGSPRHLDVVGLNYYWTNQWELLSAGKPLSDDDPRRQTIGELVTSVWRRYGHEMIITETSHIDEMRPGWLRELACEAEAVLTKEIPLRGICLYPILGMPEWHTPEKWTQMGLWELQACDGALLRAPYSPMIDSLREAQARLPTGFCHTGVGDERPI